MANPQPKKTEEISIVEIQKGRVDLCVLGASPLILNRMSEKAARELLMPRKKTAADKASNLKHDPIAEFRASFYRAIGDKAETRLMMPATAFKGALRSVAVDIPGAAKAQIGRLTYIEGDYVNIYGAPRLFMSITRSADMNKTPDVRTRAIVPAWAARISITYIKPLLKEVAVVNLMAAAGVMRGVGDWRPEKGSGNYGQFTIVSPDDETFGALVKAGGRAAQDAAIAAPECYDAETADLLSWFTTTAKDRGFKTA